MTIIRPGAGGTVSIEFLDEQARTAAAAALNRANHTGTQPASTVTEDATHRFVTDAERTAWNAGGNAVDQTAREAANEALTLAGSASNYAADAMTAANDAIEALANISAAANAAQTTADTAQQNATDAITAASAAYGRATDAFSRTTHTGTQPASTVTEDATHRFVTDAQITAWSTPITISATAPENPVLNQLWLQP